MCAHLGKGESKASDGTVSSGRSVQRGGLQATIKVMSVSDGKAVPSSFSEVSPSHLTAAEHSRGDTVIPVSLITLNVDVHLSTKSSLSTRLCSSDTALKNLERPLPPKFKGSQLP